MQESKGRSNAQTLFRIKQTPTDPQIRNLLDPIAPTELYPLFPLILEQLEQAGELSQFRDFNQTLLVPLDGTQYFSPQKIHCAQCSQRALVNGETLYSHRVITPVVVKPGQPHILPLEPEFIVPQDGASKQDCELTAAKGWLGRCGSVYAAYRLTLLADDLYCHQPFCQLVLAYQLNFIFVCKPDSHPHLYEWLTFLQAGPEEQLPSWNTTSVTVSNTSPPSYSPSICSLFCATPSYIWLISPIVASGNTWPFARLFSMISKP